MGLDRGQCKVFMSDYMGLYRNIIQQTKEPQMEKEMETVVGMGKPLSHKSLYKTVNPTPHFSRASV